MSTVADPFEQEIFAARLSPYRSLPRRGFRVLLMVFAGACFITGLPFVALGAWPIVSWMGLDVVVFYLAFRSNYRAARAYEHIRLTPLELQLARVSPRGARTEWRFNTAWVRLERREHEEFGLERLALVSRDKRVEIARFLGPDQKAEFAEALARALSLAKRGPQFS
ncbi:MAG: DUF2244 domain-containing protein [Methylobacteriaceae bacterium]|nr:DUF2244 domain-containing protein [Methylobacteriaceae bacterium]MBV9221788.1 DUF2244 domain-containing protein [Methylobacteriaceae bacterium]MBV9243761.1 DUF2244 domain-containing protein [Methylobacteriaceae bacterium]MBV9637226.1 DUF2244 domain-containing protein [Methylobacteriaceae bacterium]MBV9704890.1 DUF2244 domain-containing protein [Methylobacteriaceae bacterium]